LIAYVLFGLAIAAAAGLQAVQSDVRLRRLAAAVFAAAGLVLLGGFLLDGEGRAFAQPVLAALWQGIPDEDGLALVASAFARACRVWGIPLVAIALVLAFVRRWDLRAGAIATLVVLHLFFANGALYGSGGSDILTQPSLFVEQIRSRDGDAALGGARV